MKIRGTTIATPIRREAVVDNHGISGKPWSSQNTVEKWCPTFTESGSAINCKPIEGYPLKVTSDIALKQEGSGDASPENIRPIRMYTEIALNHCAGRNLYGFTNPTNVTYISTSGVETTRMGFRISLPSGSYTLHAEKIVDEVPAQYRYLYGTINRADGTAEACSLVANLDYYTRKISLNEGDILYLYNGDSSSTAEKAYELFNVYHNVQIESGNTATPYEPYMGNLFTAEFGSPVFGSYNWNTGELKQTRAAIILDGTGQWYLNSGLHSQFYFNHGIANCANWGEFACSHFIGSNRGAYDSQQGHMSSSKTLLWICDKRFDTVDSLKAYLAEQYAAGTPVTAVVTLAEPIVTQYEPVEIQAMDGDNLLSSGEGTITVSGKSVPGGAGSGADGDISKPEWGSETSDGEVVVYAKTMSFGNPTDCGNCISAPMTAEEYRIMLACEDFTGTYDNGYSAPIALTKDHLRYDELNGAICFDTLDFASAYASISFSNRVYRKIPASYVEAQEQTVQRIVGNADSPVILRNLGVGAYIIDGVVKTYPTMKGSMTWYNTFVTVTPYKDTETTYVQAMFPVTHAINLYEIKDTSHTLTRTNLKEIVDDISTLKETPAAVTSLSGTADSPIILRELDAGVYVLNGTVKTFSGSASNMSWKNTFVVVAVSGSTTYVQAHFPISNAIHLYTINSGSHTLTTGYFDKMLKTTGGTMTGILNMDRNRITNLSTPSAGLDAANKQYVDNAVANAIAAAIEEGLSE